ncbi:hypothetical protein HPB50_014438 [Hyalomma asiaticum]|uniref:Uncharacterized protein n=1 Tax=Hyalomma asiaticum TaxID=266040 RepID=A0ACB7TKW8_HYAAI|nr:hypothetical protein HPB50_014438 [Hyalomma asiaticum]
MINNPQRWSEDAERLVGRSVSVSAVLAGNASRESYVRGVEMGARALEGIVPWTGTGTGKSSGVEAVAGNHLRWATFREGGTHRPHLQCREVSRVNVTCTEESFAIRNVEHIVQRSRQRRTATTSASAMYPPMNLHLKKAAGALILSPSSELEASTERPVLLAANSQTKRIIPQVTLAGYHLRDPRGKDYGSRFHGKSIREGYMENRTTSTLEERNTKQLYDNNGALAGPSSQIHSVNELPLVISADNSRSDMYGAAHRDNSVAQHSILHTAHHWGQEFANFCPRPIESPANCWERRSMPEYFVGYPPMVPKSEVCLLTNFPRPLANVPVSWTSFTGWRSTFKRSSRARHRDCDTLPDLDSGRRLNHEPGSAVWRSLLV